MEYTVQKLAVLSGISARTLRFYDEIGLLRPGRVSGSGYRIYGSEEVDALQQILFFRELGLELSTIRAIVHSPSFDRAAALRSHLETLEAKKARLDLLIANVKKTIAHEEGNINMSDKEKFEGFKQKQIDENEAKYGKEARERYGDDAVDQSNKKWKNMSKEQYEQMQALAEEVLQKLQSAVQNDVSPTSEAGRECALLHKQWLSFSWPAYNKEAHLALTQMYVDDERFTAYYDTQVPGCAMFLRDAVHAWEKDL